MPTPSLLIVPARFKSGKLYSQIPTSGAGDFTVTRATTATRVNASGFIESVASGIPRLDYFSSDGTVGCPALLVEPSGSNLAFHSSDWTSNWNAGVLSGTTVVTNSAISLAPDGTATANEIYSTSGNTNHIRQSNSTTAVTYVSGTVYTQSAFFKAGVGVGIQVQLNNPTARFGQLGYANFDLIAGTVLVVSGTTADTNRAARIENYGNGWYRCSYTATCTLAGTGGGVVATLIAASGDTRNPSFSGTVTDYLLGWGAQLETGSVATSYIPTTTAAVTRNADVVSVSGAVSGSIGQTEGTIYCEYIPVASGPAGASFFTNIITSARNININTGFSITHRQSNNTLRVEFFIGNGTLGAITLLSGTVAFGNVVKVAFAYKTGDFALAINGNVVQTTSVPFTSVTTINTIELTNPNIYFGYPGTVRHRDAALYTTRLTNAELQALTA